MDGILPGAPVAAGVAAGLYGAKKLGLGKLGMSLAEKKINGKSIAEKREELKFQRELGNDYEENDKGEIKKKKDQTKGGGGKKTKTKKLSRKKLKKQINRLQSSLKKLQKTRKKNIQLFF